jgi:hypothetical protein
MCDAIRSHKESIMRTPIYILAAAGILACAERNYAYTPQTANAVAAGLPAARTAIPQERPQGAIEVTSYGTTELKQAADRIPVLHVRAIVTNDGDDTAWTFDTRRQAVDIPGEGRSAPIYANADVQTLPTLAIGRGERRVVDLYFPLPATMQDDAHLPRFELLWEVTTPERTIASRTSFERVERDDSTQVAYGYDVSWPLWVGYGPYWWYDPFYRPLVFTHPRAIVIRDHRAPIVVGRFGGHFRAGGAHVARGGRRR